MKHTPLGGEIFLLFVFANKVMIVTLVSYRVMKQSIILIFNFDVEVHNKWVSSKSRSKYLTLVYTEYLRTNPGKRFKSSLNYTPGL